MTITKKHILYSSIITIGTVAFIIGGSVAFRSIEKREDKAATNVTEEMQSHDTTETDSLVKKADAARASRQYDEATDLYHQARAHYERTGDIEKLAEIDATLSLLEVEKKNTPEPIKPELAGER